MNSKTPFIDLPVYLDKRSFKEKSIFKGQFGKYEKLPALNSEMKKDTSSEKNNEYTINSGNSVMVGHSQQKNKPKMQLLMKVEDGKITLSEISKDFIFSKKILEDSEDLTNKTFELMRNKKIKKKKQKEQIEGDFEKEEGNFKRFN